MSVQIIDKRLTPGNYVLTAGLSAQEFRCKCDNPSCCAIFVSDQLLLAYDYFRRTIQRRLRVNSGHRCQWYNHHLRAEKGLKTATLSRHMTGEAIDISKKGLEGLDRNYIIQTAKDAGFTTIIEYETFWHFDVRKEHLNIKMG